MTSQIQLLLMQHPNDLPIKWILVENWVKIDILFLLGWGLFGPFVFLRDGWVLVFMSGTSPLHWRHNDPDGVLNHQPHGCLLNRLFRRRSKKTSKLRVTGLCVGNSPGPVNSPRKGPVTRKMFPFDDVIMSPSKFGQVPNTKNIKWFCNDVMITDDNQFGRIHLLYQYTAPSLQPHLLPLLYSSHFKHLLEFILFIMMLSTIWLRVVVFHLFTFHLLCIFCQTSVLESRVIEFQPVRSWWSMTNKIMWFMNVYWRVNSIFVK